MKKHSWSFICLSVLLLFVVACNPVPPPRLEVIIPAPTQVIGEPMEAAGEPAEAAAVETGEEVIEIAAPSLTSPSPGSELSQGDLTLSGTGEPGSAVQVLVNGQAVGLAEVGGDGAWSLSINLTEPGEYELRAQVLDAAGAVAAEAEPVSISLVAAMAAVAPPTLNLPVGGLELEPGALVLTGAGEPGTKVQVLVNGQSVGVADVGSDGAWSLEISLTEPGAYELTVQALDAGGAVAAEAEPVPISVTAPPAAAAAGFVFPADEADVIVGELTLIGAGEPGSEVEVLDNSVVLGIAEVSAAGEWSFTLEPAAGRHAFTVRAVGDQAAAGPAVEVNVVAASESYDCSRNLGLNRGDNYIVGTCDTLREISQRLDVDFEALIAANPQVTENLDLIYPGQILIIPQ